MLSRENAGEDFEYTTAHDQDVSESINSYFKKRVDFFDEAFAHFPVYVRRFDLSRFLAHVELCKMALNVPGSFVECGVYKGVGLLTWAKLLDMFCPGDTSRKVFGFDNFKGFPSLSEQDGAANPKSGKVSGGWNPKNSKAELDYFLELFQRDKFLPRSQMIELIEGDIRETAARFVKRYPGLGVALLHLDVDLYEPTLAALKAFYPKVVNGGVVVVDEYALKDWGATKAVEEFFDGKPPVFRKFPFFTNPGGYFIKEV